MSCHTFCTTPSTRTANLRILGPCHVQIRPENLFIGGRRTVLGLRLYLKATQPPQREISRLERRQAILPQQLCGRLQTQGRNMVWCRHDFQPLPLVIKQTGYVTMKHLRTAITRWYNFCWIFVTFLANSRIKIRLFQRTFYTKVPPRPTTNLKTECGVRVGRARHAALRVGPKHGKWNV